MQRLKTAGVDTVRLGVDSENPSGAGRLYESVSTVAFNLWNVTIRVYFRSEYCSGKILVNSR